MYAKTTQDLIDEFVKFYEITLLNNSLVFDIMFSENYIFEIIEFPKMGITDNFGIKELVNSLADSIAYDIDDEISSEICGKEIKRKTITLKIYHINSNIKFDERHDIENAKNIYNSFFINCDFNFSDEIYCFDIVTCFFINCNNDIFNNDYLKLQYHDDHRYPWRLYDKIFGKLFVNNILFEDWIKNLKINGLKIKYKK